VPQTEAGARAQEARPRVSLHQQVDVPLGLLKAPGQGTLLLLLLLLLLLSQAALDPLSGALVHVDLKHIQ